MLIHAHQHPVTQTQPLQYQQRQKLNWISRHKRRLVPIALLIGIAIPVCTHRDEIWNWIQWQYWIRRAASFEMPKTSATLVESDVIRSRQLVSSNSDYVLTVPHAYNPPHAVYIPASFRQWTRFDSRTMWVHGFEEDPVAFLGTLTRPDGIKRLVIVRGAQVNALDLHDLLVLVVPTPKIFQTVPKPMWSPGSAYSGRWIGALMSTGVLDPNDSSHLVFKIEVYANPDQKPLTTEVQAYLGNDDCVRFELKSTPELLAQHVPTTQRTVSGVIPQSFIDSNPFLK